MPKAPPPNAVKRTAARVRGASSTAQVTSKTVSAPSPSVKDDSVDALIARMDRAVKEACKTPQGAKALLIRAGILTKKGVLRKKFRPDGGDS